MIIQILLIISILLQLIAATVANGLIRKTRYNLSWVLFTVALTCMAFLRFGEYIQQSNNLHLRLPAELFVWMGIVTSFCFAVGVLLVQRIFKDISRSEKQRRLSERRILNMVLRTEEKERLRFSKDLHDGLGPLLSSAKMSISALTTEKMSPRDQEIIQNVNHVINEAIRSLREVSINLSPHVLNDFGLARALANFISKLPRTQMQIQFDTNLKNERFDGDVEVILYRVVCELINNSIKHSGALQVHISMQYEKHCIKIHYRDNGCGFQRSEVAKKGMGFSNMSSRIASLKGGVSIVGYPSEGMEAIIEIPVDTPTY